MELPRATGPARATPRIHPAWIVAGVAFLALVGAAGFRSAPSVLMVPLEQEFGWSRGVLLWLRNHPADLGTRPYGATEHGAGEPRTVQVPQPASQGAARRAIASLRQASRTRTFWLLAGGFAICGASTNGLVGTHFIPSAHDHGMPETVAAGLLALVGIFDIVGTIASGWLTDRINPRILLAGY
jgi:hypothetical protein